MILQSEQDVHHHLNDLDKVRNPELRTGQFPTMTDLLSNTRLDGTFVYCTSYHSESKQPLMYHVEPSYHPVLPITESCRFLFREDSLNT